jgi:SAM-dependent methyltransferase
VPSATGTGVDTGEADLARGRAAAAARGLTGRVDFVQESATGTTRGPADVVLCLGSAHALSDVEPPGHLVPALRSLRGLVRPGGRVLLGEGFWQRPPRQEELAAMWPGARAGDHRPLGALLEAAVAAGFRPEWTETASEEEWEQFESGYLADVEEWLAAYPDDPRAAAARGRADRHRAAWTAYRGVLGLAYLTLIPVRGAAC